MDAGEGGKVVSAAASAPAVLEWKFSQAFGERMPGEEVQAADVITSVEFDKKGDHLATGDRSGRIVLFERVDSKEKGMARRDLEKMDSSVSRNHPEFHYIKEFQSHEPEFDYLKSSEIEEKINKICWCYSTNGALFLLSTNDRTIKFWKVQEKKPKKLWDVNADPSKATGTSSLASPSLHSNLNQYLASDVPPDPSYNGLSNDAHGILHTMRLTMVARGNANLFASCRRVYANAHEYQVNSISYNSDGVTFISADDLRINLWNLEISNQSFNIVDAKPTNMEDLTEVITSAEFHPIQCNLLAYGTSKGDIRLFDMRQSALGDSNSKLFAEKEEPGTRTFFTEIISSVSDVKFSMDGRHMLSRDYMTVKLWDINMDAGPVATFNVHDHVKTKLCDLYENDCIFDKFECCPSGDGSRFATGSYSNMFRVFGCAKGSTEATTLEASKHPMRMEILNPTEPWRSCMTRVAKYGTGASSISLDLAPKLLHLAWHPSENCIACASANSLYMYYA